MKHRAIRLMASKLAVAGIIEGNFSDEGLAAMSDCADMTTALARELTAGIKNEVEDLSSVFKKMAILKPEADIWQLTPEVTENIVAIADDVVVAETIIYADNAIVAEDMPVVPVPIYPILYTEEDLLEIVAHVAAAPIPHSGLLSFVNRARPNRAKDRNVMVTDDSLYDLYEAAAA